jgi:RNA polymerase sigma-70 factor (ECF subfamily)
MESVLERSTDEGDDLVALMVGYQAGRLEAFERLYSAVAPELLRYFQSRAADSASDLVQETFLEIHRARHTYTPPLPARPWIFGVARNVERRHWRRLRRRPARVVSAEDLDRKAVAAGAETTTGMEWWELEDVVRRLPPSGRDAWLLHHVLGLSFSEISSRLRIETGAARLRAHRCMTALRRILGIERRRQDD